MTKEISNLKSLYRKVNDEKYQANSKKKLSENITKKLKTTMIGALARFEENFGNLWGIGKNAEKKTEDELRWEKLWDLVRTEVLNNGNNQIRAAMEEISLYIIAWEGYNTTFIVSKDTN
jgi:hypothetical protein